MHASSALVPLSLSIEPGADIVEIGNAFDRRGRAVAADQYRARDFALPLRVDFVAQPLDEAIAEDPVLGIGEAVLASIVRTASGASGTRSALIMTSSRSFRSFRNFPHCGISTRHGPQVTPQKWTTTGRPA